MKSDKRPFISEILVSMREKDIHMTNRQNDESGKEAKKTDIEYIKLKEEEIKRKDMEIERLNALLESKGSIKKTTKPYEKPSEKNKTGIKLLLNVQSHTLFIIICYNSSLNRSGF